ncbi:TadG family pilus assembly protein [Aestuariicoccus sp. MJ-SS9]|uniref:TadG family pilus assembly protein n=1 Tax=Aestuariicoccus sp. MJ-SS9 TaxID=3079855 RepID=UPI002912B4A5|nr:TadG family pilus assembly protein [Aestuariicoccus sp. MJ-SS9]MDU8913149.1 TadG family pilus assembly protein [Aestuariicoccus sp. MJ-SS9]
MIGLSNSGITARIKAWHRDETGSFTILSLYFFMASLILAGIAIDFTNRSASESKAQAATDAVAHAALYLRDENSEGDAKAGALAVAQVGMPSEVYGAAITADDIEFGVWDPVTRTFLAVPGSNDAVRVTALRNVERGNIVENLLLRIVGFKGFEIAAQSTWETYVPECMLEGFVAERTVDMQSNNEFKSGFCIHSNQNLKLSSGNVFEDNTHVTLPIETNVQLPTSGMESNPGLDEALDDGSYRLRILRKMEMMVEDIWAGGTSYLPDYIVNPLPVYHSNKQFRTTDVVPGSVHRMECPGTNQQMNMVGGLYSQMVLITNCKIKFQNGVILEDALIISTSTTAKAMSATSGLQIGRNDNCAPGGGATLMTYGGFEAPADMQSYGGQIIARKSIEFSANASGIQGISLISGQDVIGTSNMVMGFCGGIGMDPVLLAQHFRMVE